MNDIQHIVLHVPHASIEGIADRSLSFWPNDPKFVNDSVVRLTDWYTDFVFAFNSVPDITTVRFPYSRFIVDGERLWDDPMEEIGQGIVYTDFAGFHRDVPAPVKEHLLSVWKRHQHNLTAALSPDSILIDCHSFPGDMSDVDICIGFNDDWSYPGDDIIEMVSSLFEKEGFKVGINNPYSNSMSPRCRFDYPSIMIEVNKKSYMDERTMRLHTDSHSLKISEVMERVYTQLLTLSHSALSIKR